MKEILGISVLPVADEHRSIMARSTITVSKTFKRKCRVVHDPLKIKISVTYVALRNYPDVIDLWRIIDQRIPPETTVEEAHAIAVEALRYIMYNLIGGELLRVETVGESDSHEPIRVVWHG